MRRTTATKLLLRLGLRISLGRRELLKHVQKRHLSVGYYEATPRQSGGVSQKQERRGPPQAPFYAIGNAVSLLLGEVSK